MDCQLLLRFGHPVPPARWPDKATPSVFIHVDRTSNEGVTSPNFWKSCATYRYNRPAERVGKKYMTLGTAVILLVLAAAGIVPIF